MRDNESAYLQFWNVVYWLRRTSVKYMLYGFQLLVHYLLMALKAGKKRVVPDVTNPLLLKSATALAAEIRVGKVSSESLVRAYIDRIREVEPYINAVVDSRFEEAIEEARTADAFVASGARSAEQLATEKPFLGVPFTVKMLLGVKGLRCTAGCIYFQDLKAHDDAKTVSLMKEAGAICVANTNTPEFGLNFETYNKVHGTTRNPYDTRRTCGGSSGGEAALIAAAGSVFGIGNDLGGSCRYPAFNCCIFGHKPTAGLIPNVGVFPAPPPRVDHIATAGPMCRYAEDLAPMLKILIGEKAEDFKIDKQVNFKAVKVYYMFGNCGNFAAPPLDSELKQCVQKVVRYFESTYDTLPELVHFDGMNYAFELWVRKLLSGLDSSTLSKLVGNKIQIEPSKELLKFFLRRSNFTIGSVIVFNNSIIKLVSENGVSKKWEERIEELDKEFQRILENEAVLILPTFPTTAPFCTAAQAMTYSVGYMAIFNVLGYPVTQCTLGLGSDGLPVGLQVVAGKNRDYLTLAVAREIEKAFGGWVPPGTRDIKQ